MSEKKLSLIQWLIERLDTQSYRAGRAARSSHPALVQKELNRMGGIRKVIPQARALERQGLLRVVWRNMGEDIEQLHFSPDIMEELCRMEGIEDPRKWTLRKIEEVKGWKQQTEASWLSPWYDRILERLEDGKKVRDPDLQDEGLFRCLQAVVRLTERQENVWKRVFSAAVLGDSKKFEQVYEEKVFHILKDCSPLYEEGMEKEEALTVHGILTYAQTLEWKGPLVYHILDGDREQTVDSSVCRYGTMMNAQTMEHARPAALPGVKRIVTIENKANYEDMPYREDTLYLFCHGFFSPKERRFLARLRELAGTDTEFFHWGDMDFGGIRIFLFLKAQLFPTLLPCRMGRSEFEAAVDRGAGIPLPKEKREKLAALDADCLTELKQCILESGYEIEQEILLAMEKEL